MQEALIKAYMERRGWVGRYTYRPEQLGFPNNGHVTHRRYTDWVFAWVDELTRALPPR